MAVSTRALACTGGQNSWYGRHTRYERFRGNSQNVDSLHDTARREKIAQSELRPSTFGMSGGGVYASSIGRFPANPLVPRNATVPVTIRDTSGFIRTAFPGTFLRPTGTGVAGSAAWYGIWGGAVNRDLVFNDDSCDCKI